MPCKLTFPPCNIEGFVFFNEDGGLANFADSLDKERNCVNFILRWSFRYLMFWQVPISSSLK